jgi:hypothetical protein
MFAAGVGAVLGAAIFWLARRLHMSAQSAFYPTVLIAIASYYVVFAVISATSSALALELTVASGFLCLALLGHHRGYPGLSAGAILLHGVYDLLHEPLGLSHTGVPSWWPVFCGVLDLVLGGCILAEQAWSQRSDADKGSSREKSGT